VEALDNDTGTITAPLVFSGCSGRGSIGSVKKERVGRVKAPTNKCSRLNESLRKYVAENRLIGISVGVLAGW